MKIRNDVEFIKTSLLWKYMSFSEQIDPFFLACQRPVVDNEHFSIV